MYTFDALDDDAAFLEPVNVLPNTTAFGCHIDLAGNIHILGISGEGVGRLPSLVFLLHAIIKERVQLTGGILGKNYWFVAMQPARRTRPRLLYHARQQQTTTPPE